MATWISVVSVIQLLSCIHGCFGSYPPETITIPYTSHPGCGRARASVAGAYVSGQATQAGHPWIATIRVNGQHRCEGALISPDWIVTTARCTNGIPISCIAIVLGDHDQSRLEGPEQTFSVQTLVIHPQYERGDGRDSNDIALVQLSRSADMENHFTNTVCMPVSDSEDQFVGREHCYRVGWNLQVSSILQLNHVYVRVLPQMACKQLWGDQVTNKQICVNDTDYRDGSPRCQLGNGSPVTCEEMGTSRTQLVGLTSFGDLTCGRRPYVYTRVAHYLPWIQATTGLLFSLPRRNVGVEA